MVALGEKQQAPRGFEIERLAARAERADHNGARRIEGLLGRPQTFLAASGADEDEAAWVEPKMREPGRVWRAILGEHAFLPGPDHARLPRPAGGKAQAEPQSSRLRAGPGRTQLVQRLGRHSGGDAGKTGL